MKQKQKAKELSESLLSQVLQLSPFPVVIKDSSFTIRFVNKAFCALMQSTEDNLVGTTGLENVPEEVAVKCKSDDSKVLETGETLEIEETYPAEDGQTVTFQTKKSRFISEKGNAFLIVQLQNVTDSRRQLAELQASKESLLAQTTELEQQQVYHKAILANTSDAIVLVDEHGTVKYRSARSKLIGGYTDEEIINTGIFKLIHPDEIGSALQTMRSIVENAGVPFNVEYRVQHKKGHYMWLSGTMVNHLNNEAVKAIVINYSDISWKKTALSTSLSTEVKYQKLFDSMVDMFHIIDLVYDDNGKPIDFIELEVNKAVEKIYGLPADKIIGRKITTIVDEVEQYWLEVFDEVMKTDMPAYFEEYNKGLNRYYSINAWRTESNKLAVIFKDITERIVVKQDLNRKNRLLDQAQQLTDLGGWELDLKTNQIFWTEQTYRIHEVDPETWVPTVESGIDFYTPESKKEISAALNSAIENKTDFDLELKFITAKGNLIDVRATGKTIVEESEVVKIVGAFQNISDQKQAQVELKRQAVLLENAQKIAKLGGWELDLRTNQLFWTEQTYRIHELDSENWVPTVESSVDFYTPDSQKRISEALENAIQLQRDFDLELQLVTAKKNLIDVRATGEVVVEGEEAVKVIGVFQDITKRKQSKEALIKSKERFQQVTEASDIWVWETDENGLYTFVSPNIEKVLGYSSQQVIGKMHFYDLFTEEDRERIKDLTFERFESKERLSNLVNANAHKDGHTVVLETNGFPVLDDNGDLIGYQGSDKDISERVFRDKQIVKLSKAVSQNPASVMITDLNGNIEYVNSKFEEVSGYSSKGILGKTPSVLSSGELDGSEYKTLWETILKGEIWNGVFHNVKKEGTKFWERASIGPIQNDDGDIISLMALKEDITREKEFELQLQETLENLEVTVEERTRDLKNATEELQTVHNEMLSSINYARSIQRASIPSEKSLQRVVVDAFAIYKPRDIVSGDFYWYFRTEHGVVIAVVDCTGHGVPGAMLSMIAIELLNHIVKGRKIHDPKTILEQINYGVISVLHNGGTQVMRDGMDMSVVNIDYKTRTLVYSGANSGGIVVSEESSKRLRPVRQSVGGLKTEQHKTFENTSFEFNDGDKLYLYSDGYPDQFGGPNNKKFLRKKLEKLIIETAHEKLEDQKFVLEKTLASWMEGYRQTDDITLIGLEI